MDHRRGLRHLLATRPDRQPLSPKSPPSQAGAQPPPVRFRSRAADRFVAGADEAGRGCLAGPLVAAAVLFDYERLSVSDRRILGRPARLQADDRGGAAGDVPLRAAGRRAGQHRRPLGAGIDRRGLHVTNSKRSATRWSGWHPGARRSAWSTASALPRCASRTGRGRRRPHQRRDRRRLGARQGDPRPLHARRAAPDHPGWGFEEHVGYSTPEHRAAIDELGISPLHRRSFPVVAYTQLGPRTAEHHRPGARERSRRRRRQNAARSRVDDDRRGRGDADGVEADLGVAAG